MLLCRSDTPSVSNILVCQASSFIIFLSNISDSNILVCQCISPLDLRVFTLRWLWMFMAFLPSRNSDICDESSTDVACESETDWEEGVLTYFPSWRTPHLFALFFYRDQGPRTIQ
jgi:hypothetical protein